MAHILLIGAGQLGSRYLQGLVAHEDSLAITVVDPSDASLAVARDRLAQVEPAASHDVQFATSLEAASPELDLALVVTPAHCRARVVEEIAHRHQVKSWILEKVLAQSCVQLDQIEQSLSGNGQVWVNTPMRIMDWHKSIRASMLPKGSLPIYAHVEGGSWGMGCNAIHYIDLVSWWTNASVASVDTDKLEVWTKSKRPGFQEVFGHLLVAFTDGSILKLSCDHGDNPLCISVNTNTSNGCWSIEESTGKALGPCGQVVQGCLTFQSALTAPLVKQILCNNNCDLTTLEESISQHQYLLKALLDHWNLSQGRIDSAVPIT